MIKIIVAAIFSILASAVSASSFTEFYVQTTGSNLNAGYKANDDAGAVDDAATYTYSGGTFNGTTVFTVASGNPLSDGVDVGDFASIYTTSGATVATFVSRITARDATTITVSLTAASGATSTVSEAAGAATCKIGGAWAGPSGAVGFPFGFVSGATVNASGHKPRVNFKSGETFNMTSGITHNVAGLTVFDVYTTTPGDDIGKVIFDGGASGASYTVLTVTSPAINITLKNFIFSYNGNSGSTDGVSMAGNECAMIGCVFRNMRRAGMNSTGTNSFVECEAYGNNLSAGSTANAGMRTTASGCMFIRCVSRDNTATNADGFQILGSSSMIECIASGNARNGARGGTDNTMTYLHCDFYNNGSDGLRAVTGAVAGAVANIINCNFVNNRGYGINFVGSVVAGTLYNCRFGAGTMDNDGGTYTTVHGMDIKDSINYDNDVTPWNDPGNNDFTIVLAASKGTGRGSYLQSTGGGYTLQTLGAPDIGAVQVFDSLIFSMEATNLNLTTLRIE